jgi:hypothetical protein
MRYVQGLGIHLAVQSDAKQLPKAAGIHFREGKLVLVKFLAGPPIVIVVSQNSLIRRNRHIRTGSRGRVRSAGRPNRDLGGGWDTGGRRIKAGTGNGSQHGVSSRDAVNVPVNISARGCGELLCLRNDDRCRSGIDGERNMGGRGWRGSGATAPPAATDRVETKPNSRQRRNDSQTEPHIELDSRAFDVGSPP